MESRKIASWGLGVGWIGLLCKGHRISVLTVDEWWWWLHCSEDVLNAANCILGKWFKWSILQYVYFNTKHSKKSFVYLFI